MSSTATVIRFPGAGSAPQQPQGLHLTDDEVRIAAGGYKRPADQLRELHARGFVRATRSRISGRVELERAHYEAVVSGRYAQAAPAISSSKAPAAPDRAGLRAFFQQKRKK